MRFYTLIYIVLIIFIASSLQAQQYPVKITTEKGGKTISNPDYPKEGVYDLVFNERFTIGKEEDYSKYMLSLPMSVALDKENNIYVLDKECKIFVFDKNGKYIRQFGRKGNGPGDFNYPAYFAITKENKIVLNDSRNMRICYLDLNGKYITGENFINYQSGLQTDSKNNLYTEIIVHKEIKRTEKEQKLIYPKSIIKINSNIKETGSVGTFYGESYLTRREGNTVYSMGPYNQFIWKVSPKDYLVAGFEDVCEFSKYSLDGKLIHKFGRNYKPYLLRTKEKGVEKTVTLPAFTDYSFCDAAGNYWVNLDRGHKSEYYVYDVYNQDGIFQKQVYSKYFIQLFKGNFMVAVEKTKDELFLIKGGSFSLKKR